jgi:hypothetical protein
MASSSATNLYIYDRPSYSLHALPLTLKNEPTEYKAGWSIEVFCSGEEKNKRLYNTETMNLRLFNMHMYVTNHQIHYIF